MIKPSKPVNEQERLAALRRYAVLDTEPERAFDDMVAIASGICATPMGTVSLVDTDRQWFKARKGVEVSETARDDSFCAHAILEPDKVFIVNDSHADERFHDNPLANGANPVRFYAGAPLLSADGHALGMLCVMDSVPRQLDGFQIDALQALSRQVSHLLELRRVGRELAHQLNERSWYEEQLRTYQQELETRNADLAEQTRTDPLTGLSNRRAFSVALETMVAGMQPMCVAVVDIDHFKTVNDVHGHATGDEVLVAVAQVLRAAGGGNGVVARYGGEEFVWLMPDVTLAQAQRQCESVRESVEHASLALPVTVSLGVAAFIPGESAQELFERADAAMYQAKHAGRNRVMLASPMRRAEAAA